MIAVGVCIFLVLASIVGFIGVNKTGNYENVWGYLFFYDAYALLIVVIIATSCGLWKV